MDYCHKPYPYQPYGLLLQATQYPNSNRYVHTHIMTWPAKWKVYTTQQA